MLGLRSLRGRSWLYAVFAVALALRLAFIAATPGYSPVVHDDRYYDALACSISKTGVYPPFRRQPLQESAYRPPGYPYFLAGIYSLTGCTEGALPTRDSAWPRIAGAVLDALVVVMIAWLAARWWGRAAGVAAGALASVFPAAVVVGSELVSEALFTALMLAAIVAVVRLRDSRRPAAWAGAAGVATGLATLTRFNGAILLVPLVAGAWVLRPRLSKRAVVAPALIVVACVLTVAPWTIRNANEVNAFVPVSDEAGGTLAGTYNDVARTDPDDPGAWGPPKAVPRYRPIFHDVDLHLLPETELENRLRASAIDYMTGHPAYVLEVGYRNTLRLLGVSGRDRLLMDARAAAMPGWVIRSSFAASLLVALLALAAFVSGAARGAPRFVWVAGALIVASIVFVNAEALRFQVPIAPFELLAAGAAVAYGRQWRARSPRVARRG
jgi:4-amino-4-deoxy-L-arabinose transferase-like glycosyltransferase